MISDEKILITGVRGIVGLSLAQHLAADNEVWGVARFSDERGDQPAADPDADPRSRAGLAASGITTRSIDLGSGDFGDLPTDFTRVIHLAWQRAGIDELELALRTNVEGAGLVLAHCRTARSALVMSGMGIYTGNEDPWHAYTETDPIGRGATAYAATSPASKLGVESVARFCARAFDLPITIARLNTFCGGPGSFPGMHIAAVLEGRPMGAPSDPNPHTPIHAEDLLWQIEPMLDAAGVPALVTNWCGDDDVTAQQWTGWASEWSGLPGVIETIPPAPGSPAATRADPTRRRSITGPCRADLAASFRALYDSMATGGADQPDGRDPDGATPA